MMVVEEAEESQESDDTNYRGKDKLPAAMEPAESGDQDSAPLISHRRNKPRNPRTRDRRQEWSDRASSSVPDTASETNQDLIGRMARDMNRSLDELIPKQAKGKTSKTPKGKGKESKRDNVSGVQQPAFKKQDPSFHVRPDSVRGSGSSGSRPAGSGASSSRPYNSIYHVPGRQTPQQNPAPWKSTWTPTLVWGTGAVPGIRPRHQSTRSCWRLPTRQGCSQLTW